jgi:hypothetical protein
MAAGDLTKYNKWSEAQEDGSLANSPVDFDTDTLIFVGLNATYTFNGTHTMLSDANANAVTNGTYTFTGITVNEASGTTTIDGEDVAFASDGTGFDDMTQFVIAKWAGGTDTASPLICHGDLGGTKSQQTGAYSVVWGTGGIITKT